MVVALEQFVKNLEDSGIVSPSKLKNFLPPAAAPKDARELILALVKQKHLTKFQAQEIYQGRAASLILGSYTIVDQIGAGGMGQVFKAEHRRMHRTVAIKVLPPKLMQDGAAVARFQREVEAAAKLSHPNIVTAHDADESDGRHFLVMEYVEGSDLSALVKANGPLAASVALNYLLQAARGLEFAHGEGIVHRDIKPANLLLDKRGKVKILDMGLARFDTPGGGLPNQAELTTTGTVMGTVDYMSPEQAFNTRHADARADIYSLGCTLYYLLISKPLYDGETFIEKVLAHREREIPTLTPLLSPAADEVFQHMVAKTADERYQTMSEVVEALEACVAEIGKPDPTQTLVRSNAGDGATSFATQTRQRAAAAPPPAPAAKKPAASGKDRRGMKKIFLVAAGMLAFVVAIAAVIIKLPTPDGTLVVEIDQPDATVEILNEANAVEVTRPGGAGKVMINVDPGKHRLKVSKDGFEIFVQEFSMEAGNTIPLKAKLVANAKLDPEKSDPAPATAAPDALTMNDPEFAKWVGEVAALSAEEQVKAVVAKLRELNPEYDDQEKHRLEQAVVVGLDLNTQEIADISPVRALAGLKTLNCAAQRDGRLQDLSPLKGMPLTRLTCTNSRLSDLTPLRGLQLAELELHGCSNIVDFSPLKGMPLRELWCSYVQVSDLGPLKGMKLSALHIGSVPVADLSPLEGMPLRALACQATKITNLAPLHGMPLEQLEIQETAVTDLSVLKELPLKVLTCSFVPQRDTKILRQIASLEKINGKMTAEFWKDMDAGKLDSPTMTDVNSPKFKQWAAKVAALPAEEQVKAVVAKLRELNPEFDGVEKHQIKDGVVINLEFDPDKIVDISPVSALTGLRQLFCQCAAKTRGALRDLSPLANLKLKVVRLNNTRVNDISPLNTELLTDLTIAITEVTDLSPLRGSKLKGIDIHNSPVSDLGPLLGLPLDNFWAWSIPATDLSPLKDSPLTIVHIGGVKTNSLEAFRSKKLKMLICSDTKVTDLSPLTGAPLLQLGLNSSPITDFSPIATMKRLEEFDATIDVKANAALLRSVKSLKKINGKPVAEVLGEAPNTDRDRAAAEWALARGTVVVKAVGEGQSPPIGSIDKLPTKPFSLLAAMVDDRKHPITGADLERFADLPEFTTLQIVCKADGSVKLDAEAIGALARTPKLMTVLLYSAHVSDEGAALLPTLQGMAGLGLNGSRVSAARMAELSALVKLDKLVLGFSEFNDISAEGLASLPNLRELQINLTRVGDPGVEALARLPKLAVLNLGSTRVTDKSLPKLAQSKTLATLLLDSCAITDAGLDELQPCQTLKDLSLKGTAITDAGLESVAALKNLRDLHLEKTKVTDAGVQKLQEALPKCKVTR